MRGNRHVVGGLHQRQLRCGLADPADAHELIRAHHRAAAAGELDDAIADEEPRGRLDRERARWLLAQGSGEQLEGTLVLLPWLQRQPATCSVSRIEGSSK